MPFAEPYSDYIEGAEFQEKGDKWLPLGLKHQKHVACFVRLARFCQRV